MSGRKVELGEVIVPFLNLESSGSEKYVPVMPTPTREEADDDYHETSDQVTTRPRSLNKAHSVPEWYVILSWKSCYWIMTNLRTMKKL